MRWSTVLPAGYFCLCVWYVLRAQIQTGSSSERWLPVQGLTIPWGVAISYLSDHDDWSDMGLAGVYLGAAAVNTCLLIGGLRLFGRLIRWLERLDDRV